MLTKNNNKTLIFEGEFDFFNFLADIVRDYREDEETSIHWKVNIFKVIKSILDFKYGEDNWDYDLNGPDVELYLKEDPSFTVKKSQLIDLWEMAKNNKIEDIEKQLRTITNGSKKKRA